MPEEKDDGGFFYPGAKYVDVGGQIPVPEDYPGITRRDWLAGLAMQGELASQDGSEENDWIKLEVLAERSYMIADATIAESNK